MMRRRLHASTLLAVATVASTLAACGSTAATGTPSAVPMTVEPATQPPTTTPPATAGAPTPFDSEPCAVEPADSYSAACLMPAGDYHSTRFGSGVSFTLISDWRNVSNEADQLAAVKRGPHPILADDMWLTFVSGPPEGRDGPIVNPDGVADGFGLSRRTRAGLDITSIEPGQKIGGRRTLVFDVVNNGTETAVLFTYPSEDGAYYLNSRAAIRVWWLTVDGTPTVVMIEARVSEFDAFVESMQPTLDSIAWD